MKLLSVFFVACIGLGSIILACTTEPREEPKLALSEEFKNYWYDGNAEISSFQLYQERYGEIREGTSVMIFVTEQFSKSSRTKSDVPTDEDPPIMKLNFTKNFETGIYPYSIMLSTFLPLEENAHSLKVAASTQEWCGQTYMELNRSAENEIDIHSYFEGESVSGLLEDVVYLEDDLWSLIRLDPALLPVGEFEMIPSFTYMRLMHIETKVYSCDASLEENDGISKYELFFEELNRGLEIEFESSFPYRIIEWEETYPCGKCENSETLTSSGKLMETIKVDYWNENGTQDTLSRYNLGLH